MNNKNPLHVLIHSMNNNEKRYFQLFSSRHTIGDKNNYVKLFDVIARQKQYDDDEIKKTFEGTSIGNNLRVNKHYLYNLILKSLNSFHANSSARARLREMTGSIEILFERGLYEQCEKILEKAIKTAQKYELDTILLDLYKWDYQITVAQYFLNKSEEHEEERVMNVIQLLDKIKKTSNIELISSKILMTATKTGRGKNQKEINRLQKLISTDFFADENSDQSYDNLFTILQGKLLFYQIIINDKEKANYYGTQIVKLIEDRPHFNEKNPMKYGLMLLNLANTQLFLKKFSALEQTFIKLWKIVPEIPSGKNREFLINGILGTEIANYNDRGEFDKSIILFNKYEEHFNTNDLRVGYVTNFNIANAFFGTKNYKKAIQFTNKIINQPLEYRSDTQCLARILNIIIHYEMENIDLLEYTVKSTYRFILKKQKLYKFEELLLKFIRKTAIKNLSQEKTIEAFKELKKELQIVIEDPDEKIALESIDAISWLESKIDQKPFDVIVKQKAKQLLH